MDKFGLKAEHYRYIKKIFETYLPGVSVFVFGSRADGSYKTYSDLDIALKSDGSIDTKITDQIQENFSESQLPIKIDIVLYDQVEPSFKDIINKKKKPL